MGAQRNSIGAAKPQPLDTSGHPSFVAYYAQESLSERTLQRYMNIRDAVLRVLNHPKPGLRVADIGCGAGAQCHLWIESGHQVLGIDINQQLIELARQRAIQAGLDVSFEVSSATDLPWPDQSIDICLMPELLEHVVDWQSCLKECARVLRPHGLLYLSTSNKLCPSQQEFDLPLYSWYPGFLKRRYERLAVTTRPELVNHATFPAVNWFTFYSLRSYLRDLGFDCMDRFDAAALHRRGVVKLVLAVIRHIPLLRFFAHVVTPYTVVIAIKRP